MRIREFHPPIVRRTAIPAGAWVAIVATCLTVACGASEAQDAANCEARFPPDKVPAYEPRPQGYVGTGSLAPLGDGFLLIENRGAGYIVSGDTYVKSNNQLIQTPLVRKSACTGEFLLPGRVTNTVVGRSSVRAVATARGTLVPTDDRPFVMTVGLLGARGKTFLEPTLEVKEVRTIDLRGYLYELAVPIVLPEPVETTSKDIAGVEAPDLPERLRLEAITQIAVSPNGEHADATGYSAVSIGTPGVQRFDVQKGRVVRTPSAPAKQEAEAPMPTDAPSTEQPASP